MMAEAISPHPIANIIFERTQLLLHNIGSAPMNDAPLSSFHHRNEGRPGELRPEVNIGCSGWVYRHWKDSFYPRGLAQKQWFGHYASTFNTVEINASFYRVPPASTFDGWRDKAPPGFRYAVKVNRFITHSKKLVDCVEPLTEFATRARRLGRALGPLLHQLPPSLHRDDARLAAYLSLLPRDIEHVVEFRHASWYDEHVLALLDSAGVGFVVHDLVGLPSPAWASGRIAYVRFHGTSGKYVGRYSDAQTRCWAGWLRDQMIQGRSTWAFFNNDIHGHAIDDARALAFAVTSFSR